MHPTIARLSSTALCGLTALWMSGCRTQGTTPLGIPAAPVARVGVEISTEGPSGPPRASGASGASGASEGDAGAPRPSCSAEDAKENCHRWTVLVGYPVDQATQRARAAGFTGKIDVGNLAEHDAACKDGLVCSVTPKRWELGQGETLTLWVNRKVAISTPE
jgi:hypothetical protein